MQISPDPFPAAATALRFELKMHPRYDLALLQVSGVLVEDGWPQLLKACLGLASLSRLLDFSGITDCQTTSDAAASFGRQLARRIPARTTRPSHVLIAPGDLLFGLCRVIQMNLDMARMKTSVARSIPAAILWLEAENLLLV